MTIRNPRTGFKLLEMTVAMGLLVVLLGFWGQIFLRLQRNADRQQDQAKGGVALEQFLSQLRRDVQSARRVVVTNGDDLKLEPSAESEAIVYRREGATIVREAAERRVFVLPPDAAVHFEAQPSAANISALTVKIEGERGGFRGTRPVHAAMTVALRVR